jgi:hypothetical protein
MSFSSTNRPQFFKKNVKLSSSFMCDQICNNHCYESKHAVVMIKSDLNVQTTNLKDDASGLY